MFLLPKSHTDFSKAGYWNLFYKQYGRKSFEWYGEFADLQMYLTKYLKFQDNILNVGCGNSTLGMSLYDVGYKNLVNIDLSDVVIKEMRSFNQKQRPGLAFECMDATKMTYENDKFNVVLDKGTLDALMPDTKKETVAMVNTYLKEVTRVIRVAGRYICISLLEEHILQKILSHFTKNNFMIRVIKLYCRTKDTAEKKEALYIPVFMVVATKLVHLEKPLLEVVLHNDHIEREASIDAMTLTVGRLQKAAFLSHYLRQKSLTSPEEIAEICVDLSRPSDKTPRYKIYVLDQCRPEGAKSYAAFIVPQGKEMDWLFVTERGRKQVVETTQRDRLAIVLLRREHKYVSVSDVQTEVEQCIRDFAPTTLPENYEIPYLSMPTQLGFRNILYEGVSKISGPFVVEDVQGDDSVMRRLIFLNNEYVIQSEISLKKETSENDDQEKVVIDHDWLTDKHLVHICLGISMVVDPTSSDEILIVGLGGGTLCTYLYKCFPKLKITVVEIDKAMLNVAVDYFHLPVSERLEVHIGDGLKFIKKAATKGKKYAAIIFDVDSKDTTSGMSCPPKEFLEHDLLEKVVSCLTKRGLFILNLVSRDSELREKAKKDLCSFFTSVVSFNLEDYVNEEVMCSNGKWVSSKSHWEDEIRKAATNLSESTNSDVNELLPTIMEDLSIVS